MGNRILVIVDVLRNYLVYPLQFVNEETDSRCRREDMKGLAVKKVQHMLIPINETDLGIKQDAWLVSSGYCNLPPFQESTHRTKG